MVHQRYATAEGTDGAEPGGELPEGQSTLPPPCLQPQPLSASKPRPPHNENQSVWEASPRHREAVADIATVLQARAPSPMEDHNQSPGNQHDQGAARHRDWARGGEGNRDGDGIYAADADPLNELTNSQLNMRPSSRRVSDAPRVGSLGGGFASPSAKATPGSGRRQTCMGEEAYQDSVPRSGSGFDGSMQQLPLVYSEAQRHESLGSLP
eukprot:gene16114-22257_t